MAVDISPGPEALVDAWHRVGSHVAVTAGSGTALLSLLQDVPIRHASLRGATAWILVLGLVRLGAVVARKTWVPPKVDEEDSQTNDDTEPTENRERNAA